MPPNFKAILPPDQNVRKEIQYGQSWGPRSYAMGVDDTE